MAGAGHVCDRVRDDAAYEPPVEANLISLRAALGAMQRRNSEKGLATRVKDLLGRLRDQVIGPMRESRGMWIRRWPRLLDGDACERGGCEPDRGAITEALAAAERALFDWAGTGFGSSEAGAGDAGTAAPDDVGFAVSWRCRVCQTALRRSMRRSCRTLHGFDRSIYDRAEPD